MSPYDDGWLACIGPCWCGKHITMRAYEQVRLFCAMAAHEQNRVYCRALGDISQPLWDDAPEWQRESALKGVDGVFAGNDPRKSHESWREEKRTTGWKYGAVKDPEKKEHPCFVPYDELPPEQKQKDAVFVNTVHTMAQALGHPVPGGVPAVTVNDGLQVTARSAD